MRSQALYGGGGSLDWGYVQRLGEGPVQRPLYGMTDRAKNISFVTPLEGGKTLIHVFPDLIIMGLTPSELNLGIYSFSCFNYYVNIKVYFYIFINWAVYRKLQMNLLK